jgi:hypothetical protein
VAKMHSGCRSIRRVGLRRHRQPPNNIASKTAGYIV